MKLFKQITAILSAAAMLFSLAACGDENPVETTTSTTAQTVASTETTIAGDDPFPLTLIFFR